MRQGRAFVLGLCALAFFLSTWNLGARHLWGDEAFSVWASRQPIPALIGGLDAQPPLYHILLAAARALWGESPFAVRFLSAMCATLLVALVARLGRRLGGPSVGVISALAIATSPLLIYFAQEARMYTPAALFATAAVLLAWSRRVDDARGPAVRRSAVVLGYVGCALAALFTHYYTVGVLLVTAAATGWAAWRWRRRRVEWLAAHAAIGLIFGAWFLALQSRYVARSAAGRARLVPLPDEIAANFVRGVEGMIFGLGADGSLQLTAVVLFALAIIGGVIGYRSAARSAAGGLVVAWMAAALGVVLLTASPSAIVPDFHPRYFLFALPALALAAAGWSLIARARRRSKDVPVPSARSTRAPVASAGPVILLVTALLFIALSGNRPLFDSSWQKSRYAELMAVLHARQRPGDVIVMMNSDQYSLAEYYRPPALPVWIPPNDRLNDEPALRRELEDFIAGQSRVWLIRFGWAMSLPPRAGLAGAVADAGVLVFEQGFQDAALSLYALRSAQAGAPVQPRDVGFGRQIRLIGVRAGEHRYHPGDAIALDLIWRAERKPDADYTVFMHLRRADDDGQIAAFDSPPLNGGSPTSSWAPGDVITDTRAVQIPLDARPGEYNVVIGWYHYPSFERLTIDGQQTTEHVVERITISPP